MMIKINELIWYFINIIVFLIVPLIKTSFIINEKIIMYFLLLILIYSVFYNIISFLNGKTMIAFQLGKIENTKEKKNQRIISFIFYFFIYGLLLFFIIFKSKKLIQ